MLPRLVLRGGHPLMRLDLPGLSEFFCEHGSDAQLAHLPAVGLYEAETADARIRIAAESDTRAMARIDPAKQAVVDRAREPIRRAAGRKRWVLTQYPTAAYAADAAMDLAEYEAYVARRCSSTGPTRSRRGKSSAGGRRGWCRSCPGSRRSGSKPRGPTSRSRSPGGRGSTPTAGGTCRRARSSRDRSKTSARGGLRCGFPVCRGGRELVGIELEFEDGRVVSATGRSR